MAKQSKFNLGKVEKGGRTAMERSMILIGNEAKNFFVASFRKQGFEDKTVEKWKKRKNAERKGRGKYAKGEDGKRDKNSVRSVKSGRAILVKSGDLRRSIIRQPVNKANLSVKISTDLPYAKVHNEGGGFVSSRSGKGTINTKVRGNARFENGKFTRGRAKKVQLQGASYTTGSYAMNMPKRQFMGDSYKLNEMCKKIIISQLDKIFK